ncbi:MAG: NlpC/P60 family protein [Planctomycetota bacterium]
MVQHDPLLVANGHGAFVFEKPTDARGVVTRLRGGERVYHTGGSKNGWFEIFGGALAAGGSAERGDRGWVLAEDLVPCDPADPSRTVRGNDDDAAWRRVSALLALGFDEATRKRRPATLELPGGAWVRVADFMGGDPAEDERNPLEAGDWFRIMTPGGRDAWVQSADVTPHDMALLDELRRFVGRPYVWGGSDGFGMDCSGLVAYAARWRLSHPHQTGTIRPDASIDGHALWLPHSARRQFGEAWPALATAGEDRSLDDIAGNASDAARRDALGSAARTRWASVVQPGDIAYFAMGGKRVDHVGFVESLDDATGEATLLHASSAGQGGIPAGPCVRRELLWPQGDAFPNKLAARMVGLRRFKHVDVATHRADT